MCRPVGEFCSTQIKEVGGEQAAKYRQCHRRLNTHTDRSKPVADGERMWTESDVIGDTLQNKWILEQSATQHYYLLGLAARYKIEAGVWKPDLASSCQPAAQTRGSLRGGRLYHSGWRGQRRQHRRTRRCFAQHSTDCHSVTLVSAALAAVPATLT